jgi:hypothetical protein
MPIPGNSQTHKTKVDLNYGKSFSFCSLQNAYRIAPVASLQRSLYQAPILTLPLWEPEKGKAGGRSKEMLIQLSFDIGQLQQNVYED